MSSTTLIPTEEISKNTSTVKSLIPSQKRKQPGNITPNVTQLHASIHNFENLSIGIIFESIRHSILSLSKLNTTIQENCSLYDNLCN